MRKGKGLIRRSAAILAVSVGVLAVTGSNATAAVSSFDGSAFSQAVKVELRLPALNDLRDTLVDAGLPVSSIPDTNLAALTLNQIVSLNNASVVNSTKTATGFAAPLQGDLGNVSTTSTCKIGGKCTKTELGASESILAPKTIKVLDLPGVIDGGIGEITLSGASSVTKSYLDTRNETALAKVNLDLANLIGKGKLLEPVGDALFTLTDTVNGLLDGDPNDPNDGINGTLASTIGDVEDTLEGSPAAPIKEELDNYIELDPGDDGIKLLPDLREVDLLDLTVLASKADVFPKTEGGVQGLLAQSTSKVKGLSILGGWSTLDALGISTNAFANGVKGGAHADYAVEMIGADLAGLVGLDVDAADILRLSNPDAIAQRLYEVAAEAGLCEDGVGPACAQIADVIDAIEILYSVAGISVEVLPTDKAVDPNGFSASAVAGTLRITVAPQIPDLTDADGNLELPSLGVDNLVPDELNYVDSGIALQIDLPNSHANVALNNKVSPQKFPPTGRTGVATPIFAAMLMLGAAVVVRRFALGK